MDRYKLEVYHPVSGKWLMQKNWDEPSIGSAIAAAFVAVKYMAKQHNIPVRYFRWELHRRSPFTGDFVLITFRAPIARQSARETVDGG